MLRRAISALLSSLSGLVHTSITMMIVDPAEDKTLTALYVQLNNERGDEAEALEAHRRIHTTSTSAQPNSAGYCVAC